MNDRDFLPYLQKPMSLSKFNEDLDPEHEIDDIFGDHGQQDAEAYSKFDEASLLECLTNRQRLVAQLLLDGYKRKEIAQDHLHVVLQAVHQIIPRIRKRLIKRAGELGIETRKLHGFLQHYEN